MNKEKAKIVKKIITDVKEQIHGIDIVTIADYWFIIKEDNSINIFFNDYNGDRDINGYSIIKEYIIEDDEYRYFQVKTEMPYRENIFRVNKLLDMN